VPKTWHLDLPRRHALLPQPGGFEGEELISK
jgi:hypothetical protein